MNKFDKLETLKNNVIENQYLDWTEEFEEMMEEFECPKCLWEPDCDDSAISYSPKKYDYYLSLQSSFPQYVWSVIYECPKCLTRFKVGAESC